MYDLHSHILAGLDDGAKTLEESMAMVRLACHSGTRGILATPHSKDVQEANAHGKVKEQLAELQRGTSAEGLDIQVFLGMENHLTPDLPELLDQGHAYTINKSSYVLVELPFTLYPDYVENTLFQLQLKGFIPIIAHPERQEWIQRNPVIMEGLVNREILGQLTTTSMLGAFGEKALKTSLTLLQHNLVHIIASDAHRPRGPRIPDLSNAVKELEKLVGRERAVEMSIHNPKAILEGRSVVAHPPVPFPQKMGWRVWQRFQQKP